MGLPTVTNFKVPFFHYHGLFSLRIYILGYFCWCPQLPFETGYLPLSLFVAPLTFEVAVILILKHAAVLSISQKSDTRPTITKILIQAESNFQKANIMSKIQEHFTASCNEYTIDQMVQFLMDTDIGMSILFSLRQLFTNFTDT